MKCLIKKDTIAELVNLVNEAKRTGFKEIANITFASLLHEAIDVDEQSVIWGWEASEAILTKFTNRDTLVSIVGLLYLKSGNRNKTANIPFKLLKPWVAECCLEKITELYFKKIKEQEQEPKVLLKTRVEHKRKIIYAPPTQKDYLLKKLEELSPHYEILANKYLL